MSPGNDGGAARSHSDGPTSRISPTTQQDDQRDQGSAPRVWAVAYPPAGLRRYWLLVVQSCPKCTGGGPHAHRGGQDGGLRRAGCGQGRYFVQPRLSVNAQRGVA